MTVSAGFDDLTVLMNRAWRDSPVCQDVTYTGSSGAETVRAEITREYAPDLGISDEAILATVDRGDVDASGALLGDTIAFGGGTYSIVEAQEQPNDRVTLVLNRTA